jgi:hypothetical protein
MTQEETKIGKEFIDEEIKKLQIERMRYEQQVQQLTQQLGNAQVEHTKLVGAIEAFTVLGEKLQPKQAEE